MATRTAHDDIQKHQVNTCLINIIQLQAPLVAIVMIKGALGTSILAAYVAITLMVLSITV